MGGSNVFECGLSKIPQYSLSCYLHFFKDQNEIARLRTDLSGLRGTHLAKVKGDGKRGTTVSKGFGSGAYRNPWFLN